MTRLVPELPFPTYAFLPGKGKHPHHNPEHWDIDLETLDQRVLSEDNFTDHQRYLLGIDLFNHQYFWETHEVFEGIWNDLNRKGDLAELSKGIILLGAAGVVEAIFSILAIRDQVIPPTINLDNPDPECDLDYVPHEARDAKIRTAISNSFGFGGTNASLVFRAFD